MLWLVRDWSGGTASLTVSMQLCMACGDWWRLVEAARSVHSAPHLWVEERLGLIGDFLSMAGQQAKSNKTKLYS